MATTSLNEYQRPPQEVLAVAYEQNLGRLDALVHPKKSTGRAIFLIVLGLATVVSLVGFFFLWAASRMPALDRKQAARRLYLFGNGFVELDGRGQVTGTRSPEFCS